LRNATASKIEAKVYSKEPPFTLPVMEGLKVGGETVEQMISSKMSFGNKLALKQLAFG
jgi:hypothetical protein